MASILLYGYGLCEAKNAIRKNALARSLRGVECELPVRTSAGLWYHLVWLRPILAEKYTTHSLAVDLERTTIEAWKRTSRASRRIDG